jgi:cephalosporin hydroxylase
MRRVWHTLYLVIIAVLFAVIVRVTRDRDHLLAEATASLPHQFQAALLRKTNNFGHVTWLGHPIWQPVLDVWTLQETLAEVRPALMIECGTYKGGSALFMAHLFDLMNHGHVITVDIEKQHDLAHPRITFLLGDCAADSTVTRIRAEAERIGGPVMVLLDSDHSASHVAKEMAAYAPLVTPGSYLHVQDGLLDLQPRFAGLRPGPLQAIEAFLPDHPEFVVDREREERFLITHHPKGWLQRVR